MNFSQLSKTNQCMLQGLWEQEYVLRFCCLSRGVPEKLKSSRCTFFTASDADVFSHELSKVGNRRITKIKLMGVTFDEIGFHKASMLANLEEVYQGISGYRNNHFYREQIEILKNYIHTNVPNVTEQIIYEEK